MKKYMNFFKILFSMLLIVCSLRPDSEFLETTRKKKKQLKILMILHSFPTTVQTFVINQIAYLIDKGHHVDIFAPQRKNAPSSQTDIINKYQLFRHCFFKNLPPNINSYDLIIFQFETVALKYIDKVKSLNKKAKLITFIRAGGFLKRRDIRLRNLLNKCDFFIPVCNFLAKYLISLGCDKNKVKVIYGGIDTSKFVCAQKSQKTNDITIVTTGRLAPEKGIAQVIQAIANLLPAYPNLRYLIIGEPINSHNEYKAKILSLVKNLKIKKNIKLLGFLNQDQVAKVLSASDIFILTSVTLPTGRVEGIPNALKEAMATGLPVISTIHSGIPELVQNGISGFLIRENDIKTLTEKIRNLINDPKLRLDMGLAGRQKILSDFELKTQNKKFLDFLLSVTKK